MSKYIPPHLRVGGPAAEGGGAGGGVSALRRGGENAAAAAGSPEAAGAAGAAAAAAGDKRQGTAAAGGWGVWGGNTAFARTTKPKQQQRSTNLRCVEVDSLVVMKILKHWRDFHPLPVNGQLLGSESRDKLEITNCFPLPQKKEVLANLQQEKVLGVDIEERVDEEFDRYQDRMAELMHDVNIDCFTVGWYQTSTFADTLQKDIIDSLGVYQELVDKAVVLCFDTTKHAAGKHPLRAFRVHPNFLANYRKYEQDVTHYSKLTAKDILQEVPVYLRNAFLTEACLLDAFVGVGVSSGLEAMCASVYDKSQSVERGLQELSVCLDQLSEEQEKIQKYQRDHQKQQQQQKLIGERRRLENEQRRLRGEPLLPVDVDTLSLKPVEPPSLLPALLLQEQALQHVEQVGTACAENVTKLFIMNHVAQAAKQTLDNK